MTQMLTAIEAYNQIKSSGILKGLQWQVYDFIHSNFPCTMRQVIIGLSQAGSNTGSITGRFSELRAMGLIYACGTATDSVTKKRVSLWATTNSLPIKPLKLISSRDRIAALVQENIALKKEIERLKALLPGEQLGFFNRDAAVIHWSKP